MYPCEETVYIPSGSEWGICFYALDGVGSLKTVIFTFVKPCRMCQKAHHELFVPKLNCKEVADISIINDWGSQVHELSQSPLLNFQSQYV